MGASGTIKAREETQCESEQARRRNEQKHMAAREKTQEAFRSGEISVLVANDAFGQGVDMPNIRRCIHYGVPKGLENYLNQFGRAGRDGKLAQCVLVCQPGDFNKHESNIENDWKNKKITTEAYTREIESIRALREYARQHTCRWAAIRRFYGEGADDGWRCGTCDCCRPGEFGRSIDPSRPMEFGMPTIMVLTLVWEATEKKKGASKLVSWTEMNKLLGGKQSGIKSKADEMRVRYLSSVWSHPRVRHFLEYLVDAITGSGEALLRRMCGKSPPTIINGKLVEQTYTLYELLQPGMSALQLYRCSVSAGARPAEAASAEGAFSLMLPPPLFLVEWWATQSDAPKILRSEGEGEYEEEEAAVGEQSAEDFIPDRILGERRRHGAIEYLFRWKYYNKSDDTWESASKFPGDVLASRGIRKWGDHPLVKRWHRLIAEHRARLQAKAAAEAAAEAGAEADAMEVEEAEEAAEPEAGPARQVSTPDATTGDEDGEEEDDSDDEDDEDDETKETTAEELRAVANAVKDQDKAQAAKAARAAQEAEQQTQTVQEARAALAALPFALQFALHAAEGVEQLVRLLASPQYLPYLQELGKARSRDEVKDASIAHGRPKLSLPEHRPGMGVVYKVEMAHERAEATGNEEWVVKAYKGPFWQSGQGECKLHRELGSANLVQLELHDPDESMADEAAGLALPEQQQVQSRVATLQVLLDQLLGQSSGEELGAIELCGRR